MCCYVCRYCGLRRAAVNGDLHEIIEHINCEVQGVGILDRDELDHEWPSSRLIETDQEAGSRPLLVDGQWPVFCFWLPHPPAKVANMKEIRRDFERRTGRVREIVPRVLQLNGTR